MIPLGLGGVVHVTVKAVSLASTHRCGHTGDPGTAGSRGGTRDRGRRGEEVILREDSESENSIICTIFVFTKASFFIFFTFSFATIITTFLHNGMTTTSYCNIIIVPTICQSHYCHGVTPWPLLHSPISQGVER